MKFSEIGEDKEVNTSDENITINNHYQKIKHNNLKIDIKKAFKFRRLYEKYQTMFHEYLGKLFSYSKRLRSNVQIVNKLYYIKIFLEI